MNDRDAYRPIEEAKMNAQQEFESRIEKVRDGMRDQGIQTLLVFDSGRHNFLRTNYVAYLTDFISVGPETILLLPIDDAPVLYTTPVWDIPRAREQSMVADVRSFDKFWDDLPKTTATVGLIGRESMHSDLHGRITEAIGRAPINGKAIIDNIAR